MRNCTEDEGMLVPRSRLAGAGFKTPQAAVVKSHGGERLGKVTAVTVAGVAQRDERKRTIDEASKAHGRGQNWAPM